MRQNAVSPRNLTSVINKQEAKTPERVEGVSNNLVQFSDKKHDPDASPSNSILSKRKCTDTASPLSAKVRILWGFLVGCWVFWFDRLGCVEMFRIGTSVSKFVRLYCKRRGRVVGSILEICVGSQTKLLQCSSVFQLNNKPQIISVRSIVQWKTDVAVIQKYVQLISSFPPLLIIRSVQVLS